MSMRLRHLASLGSLFVLLALAVGSSDNPNSTPGSSSVSTSHEVVENSAWDGSVAQVKEYLNKNLRDPSSFEAIEWSKVVKNSNGTYMVRCKYRAKNGFGGLNISNQVFTLSAEGGVTGVMDYGQ